MGRMTESEILEVVQAYMDGKEVEYYDGCSCRWENCDDPEWNFADLQWRIKRQPRVIWVNEYNQTGFFGSTCFDNKEDCVRPVKFIEVLDD